MKFILAICIVLLTIGSYECQSPCGNSMCMNGGLCRRNPYLNNQPTCMCRAPYSGSSCELVSSQPVGVYRPVGPAVQPAGPAVQPAGPYQPNVQPGDLCRVFNERGMSVCQNGGKCVYVTSGKVSCLCPTTHKGLFCELPVYLPCNGDPSKTCHRDHGYCAKDGGCVCNDGYMGAKCDQRRACETGYCLNGAECAELDVEPYRNCSCPPNYFGRRCDIFGIKLDNGTIVRFERSCNMSLSIFNQGGYVARYRIDHTVLGVQQETIRSSSYSAGRTWRVTLPFYAENVVVTMETTTGKSIHVDRSLIRNLPCQKCYKVWGTLFRTAWDYRDC